MARRKAATVPEGTAEEGARAPVDAPADPVAEPVAEETPARRAVDTGAEVVRTVRAVLSEPMGRDDLPVLLSVRTEDGRRTYHMVPVGGPALERAWDTYRSRFPGATPEGFVGLLYDVLPASEMFRAVSRLDI